jgi:hypothetical protein
MLKYFHSFLFESLNIQSSEEKQKYVCTNHTHSYGTLRMTFLPSYKHMPKRTRLFMFRTILSHVVERPPLSANSNEETIHINYSMKMLKQLVVAAGICNKIDILHPALKFNVSNKTNNINQCFPKPPYPVFDQTRIVNEHTKSK